MKTQKSAKDKKTSTKPAPVVPTPPAAPPSRVPPLFRKIDWIALLIALATVGIIYFLTLAPEVTLEDSGELCTGSFYAGIPHPPGYPFWAIYSWLWTKLLPVGNVAWRVEMGEAFAAAMACGLVALMVSRGSSMLMEGIEELRNIKGKWENAICLVSGTVSGVLLGLGGVMWSESVAINRISLFGVPWAMVLMMCLLRWIYAPHQRRYLYFAMFFFGICVTVHQTLLCAAMGIEVAIAYVQPRLGRNLFIWNVIIYLGGLAAESAHLSTMLDTAWMVQFLYHTVGILSFAAIIFLALKSKKDLIRPGRDVVMALLSATALGLLFAAMKSPVLFAPFLAAVWALVWLARKTKAMGWEWLVTIGLGLLWLAGASFYFYEAIAGMTDPPMQWGYPRTVQGFFHALSRGQYEQASPSNFLADPLHFLLQLGLLISDIVHEYNWVCLFLALVPLMFFLKMRKRERSWIVALTAVYSCIGILLLVLMNTQPEKQSADLNRVFFTSSHAIIAIMIGYGFALTVAYLTTHYEQFRTSALMLGSVALVPALLAFYDGVSNTFYGGVGITPYQYILLLFFLLATASALTALAAQRLFRLSDPAVADRDRERQFFFGFVAAAIVLLIGSLWLVYFRPESLSLGQIGSAMGRLFAPHQYSLPAIAGTLILGIVLAFIGGLWVYRRRAPLTLTLSLFALMPIASALSHWAGSEQRNHWFGYWFGHDMFTPPVVGPDGKMTYDAKVRAEMLKGPNAKLVYPEMAPNTILFGGTDPGRFCPTYMIFCDSFLPANCLPTFDPTFDRRDVYLITQNALADGTYLDYLRAQYYRSHQADPPFFSELARFILKDQNYQTNLLAKIVSPLDWYFEARGARIEKRWRTYTSWFTGKDFLNLPALVSKLRPSDQQDPVSKWLFQNFSKETQDLIAGSGNEDRLRESLARNLNALLGRELEQKQALAEKQREKEAVDQKIFGGDNSESLRQKQDALAKEIAIFKIEPLYDTNRFAHVSISDYLQEFIGQNPQGDTRIRLNRLLLEAAYPDEIAKSPGGVYPDREIYIPSPEDSQNCFQLYLADAQRRKMHDLQFPNQPPEVKPGEIVNLVNNNNGQQSVQVSGQTAVMAINGLLCKVIWDHNPDNEFYIEESFPLDWMYPYLTPFGIIMKLNHHQIPEITEDMIKRDHYFWSQYSERLIGNWITYDTSVKDIAAFAKRVYLDHDFTGFTGDRAFVRDDSAQKAFSKLRSSIAGIYIWRINDPSNHDPAMRQRMIQEADFALRQSFAFCPYSPEAVFRYVNFLMMMNRVDDALLVSRTCQKLDPYNSQVSGLIDNLQRIKEQTGTASDLQNKLQQMEEEIQAHPTDFQAALNLAAAYMQVRQTERAAQILDQIANNPKAPANLLITVAEGFGQMGNLAKVQMVLEKLIKATPESPEAWYDLAAIRATFGKTQECFSALKQSLDFNASRLATNRSARDLKTELANDHRFDLFRNLPEFKQIAGTQ